MSSPATALSGPQQPALAAPSQPQPLSQIQLEEEIAQLAFTLWEQRGCPHGSAELDWIEAEQRLMTNQQQAGSASR